MKLTRRSCLALLAAACRAAQDPLLDRWRRIAKQTDGTVGAAALHLPSGRHVSLNGGDYFPLASVCKLPIAIQILAMVDEGKLRLRDEIEIPVYDVVPGVSPIADRWPGQQRFPLDEMLELMIAKSDNTAVQTLFRMAGGADGMAARFRQWQIDGMRVDRTERQCALEAAGVRQIPPVEQWTPEMAGQLTLQVPPLARVAAMRRFLVDPRDTATPDATIALLRKAFRGELLSPPLTARLMAIMQATTTGEARLKGLLPAGTVVAHKTGTTATAGNLTGSTNDVGVIAGTLAIAVYVKGSTRPQPIREIIIAQIAKAAFDSHL
jgi:beta-lactamase class A